MSYFKHHVFICTNQRDNGEKCCADAGAADLQAYAKSRIKKLGLSGKGAIRIKVAFNGTKPVVCHHSLQSRP